MASLNRTALLNKTYKVLKKHYKPVPADGKRSIFEHLVYAMCLENSSYAAANRAYKALQSEFIDWNDVRVASVPELAEVMADTADPPAAAAHLRRSLQAVFESRYGFDLENLRKENLGVAAKKLAEMDGTTSFAVAYAMQNGLSAHSIPVDRGALGALLVIGAITPAEAAQGVVPGAERAIAKNKGAEFASLLHQLSADFVANCYAPSLQKILLEINDDAKNRLPKRGAKKEEPPPSAVQPKETKAAPVRVESRGETAAAAKVEPAKPEPARQAPKPSAAAKPSPARPAPKPAAKRKPR
jgi:endonuclease III